MCLEKRRENYRGEQFLLNRQESLYPSIENPPKFSSMMSPFLCLCVCVCAVMIFPSVVPVHARGTGACGAGNVDCCWMLMKYEANVQM